MAVVDAARDQAGLLLFILSGPALTVVNKAILDAGLRHPVIVSGLGMFATMIFSQVLVATGKLHIRQRPEGFWLRNCVPVGASAMATMGFGNAACALQAAHCYSSVALPLSHLPAVPAPLAAWH